MKFVDEAFARAEAGHGGKGSLSFRREKYIPRGGPDGGDGGAGGSVYLVATEAINTLIKFRYQRLLRAKNGESGKGQRRQGKSGEDVSYAVPIGTLVYDASTDELLGDLDQEGAKLCVAKGGAGGLGNVHFKSSRNRAPRTTTPGEPGEQREIKMELKVLADVGLLGLPNAGKSTFIRAVSGAIPKVADYPFTTLHPHLGVVEIDEYRSFVIADVPGIIKGASAGAGLGLQFLKHLERTRLLLHIVDTFPEDGSDPIVAIQNVIAELEQFGEPLIHKPRWLVFNKIDRLSEDEVDAYCQRILSEMNWKGPVYKVSAMHRQGTRALCVDLMNYLEKQPE